MQAAFVTALDEVRRQLRDELLGQLNRFMEEEVYAPLFQAVR